MLLEQAFFPHRFDFPVQVGRFRNLYGSTQTQQRGSLFSKYRKILRYTRKCNLVYAHEKSTPSLCRYSRNTAQQHCMQISFNKFHKYENKFGNLDRNPFTPPSNVWLSLPQFSRTHDYSIQFGNILWKELFQVRQKYSKYSNILFTPLVSVDYHSIDSHENWKLIISIIWRPLIPNFTQSSQ